jgi:hypothetical protein
MSKVRKIDIVVRLLTIEKMNGKASQALAVVFPSILLAETWMSSFEANPLSSCPEFSSDGGGYLLRWVAYDDLGPHTLIGFVLSENTVAACVSCLETEGQLSIIAGYCTIDHKVVAINDFHFTTSWFKLNGAVQRGVRTSIEPVNLELAGKELEKW